MVVPDTQQDTAAEDDSSKVVAYNPATYVTTTTSTLLPSNIANFITAVSLATRLSLRCSALFMEALFEAAKYSTVFSFGLSRQALISAISTAKKVHALTYPKDDDDIIDAERGGFLQVLDKYTSLGVYLIHHTFTLAELFALSGLQFTSNTIQTGLKAAEESVQVIDGIFGSNETSRAISAIVTLVHGELMQDPEFELAKEGKMAILGGLTKAMTAFAVLQNVTHKRTMHEMVKMTLMWKGLVVDDEEDEDEDDQGTRMICAGDDHEQPSTDIIHELEELLQQQQPENDSSLSLALEEQRENWQQYPMYEITTTTQRMTTQTTRIQPIAADGSRPRAKYVVINTDEEDRESFMAVIEQQHTSLPGAWIEHPVEQGNDENNNNANTNNALSKLKEKPSRGLKIMLSAVSKTFSRKKVERQTFHDNNSRRLVRHGSIDMIDEVDSIDDNDITMTESTSTTLRSTAAQYSVPAASSKPLPSTPAVEDDDKTIKRKSSWGRLKLKASRRKSVTSLFQKGAEALKKQATASSSSSSSSSPPPPVPSLPQHQTTTNGSFYLQPSHSSSVAIESHTSISGRRGRSNSITSMSSMAQTFTTTTTFTTAPSSPSTSTLQQPSSSSNNNNNKRTNTPLLHRQQPPQPVERRQRTLVRSPSLPSNRHKKRKPRSPLESEPDPRNFPRDHLLRNIERFSRYASAAYGESFMRILRIGDIPSELPHSAQHHANHHAFAHHTGVSVDDILLSSYADQGTLINHPKLHALVHYVTVDHAAQAVVLTCRGTLGLGDVLTDLMCEYAEFDHHGHTYMAHGGMLEAAQVLAHQRGKVYDAVMRGLTLHPSYGLVLCGHSLGAGVASLLSVLWSEQRQPHQAHHPGAALALARDPVPFVTSSTSGLPQGRPIHCYTYGPPSVMSHELSDYCGRGLVTSVVHGYDIVPSLSLGLLRDFKNVAVSLSQESSVADDILSRIIGRYSGKKEEEEDQEHHEQWFWALIKTMRADMRADKLYPPSTVYLVESTPQLHRHHHHQQLQQQGRRGSKRKHKRAHQVIFERCDDVQTRFSEIVFSRTMFTDHAPNMYENAIRKLAQGYFSSC
ncbi:sn1-specific diacylglycerol lipase alpha [Lichtheimia corymbifera JMRC:FSU:9682]|uniref:sn-1-specific diacylglycerol lipase n=2 Tax=Lichtheimia corymbifera JMRC:FSU:9682 TaxID=1263082 RepID=A0A068SCP5_9FUNG|nr:sn1-specific diacylglycerol lipase alpha [Lichtheimia corymbifera JMRC:FSU:9682]